MKLKAVCVLMLVCLSIMFLAREVSAQEEVRPLEPDWLQQMYEVGWQKVQEGVLRRDAGEGKIETYTYGAEGFQWLTEHYRQQLTYFESQYRESPTDELATLIDGLTNKVNSLQVDALAAPTAEFVEGERLEDCIPPYCSVMADAAPQAATQGVMASATAYYEYPYETASTYAYAYAQTTTGTVTDVDEQWDEKNNGLAIRSDAVAHMNGSLGCLSKASASVIFSDSAGFLSEDTNTDCPDVVSVSGPSQVSTDYYGQACADVTWTASASSGRTDYSFEWYIGTTLEGTGPTLTKRYCNETKNETVQVVARDNAGWSDDATFTTSIVHTPSVVASASGPDTVTTDYYFSPCATVTWTASATGGHPGYTYSWHIGTDPTVLGTGSTFSKQYCNASQVVTVKAIAQDSDGHTDDAIFTTNIQPITQLAVSVSGPATGTTDYYGPTCATVTWTASANGGHPGYTYNWYLGTGTTSQGTGSTFTKNYCNTTNQSVTVKAVATDSDGHTATSANFTTNVNYKRAIVATIAGPATVSTNTATPCADVTWTASASGTGHSGYTYKWYLGTSTTLQGSGSTFTKRYCSTTATVNVKLVATASDGHSDDVTFTTNITHTTSPPLSASISGPATVTLYGGCQNVTWTANVSGGTSPYTYSWKIGTSTTVLSTASTLTKNVCAEGAIDVKLTVRDSASQTASATFTTQAYPEEYVDPCWKFGVCN